MNNETFEDLKKFNAIEIIELYSHSKIIEIEDLIGMPIHLDILRTNTTEEYQNSEISLQMTVIIARLKYFGRFHKMNNGFGNLDDLDYGLRLIYWELKESFKNNFITEEQFINIKKLINLYILDKSIINIKKFFFNSINKIPHTDIIFTLHDYAYNSSVYQQNHNFDGTDIRRTTIGRIEITTINKSQDIKLNLANIGNLLLDACIDFSYKINDIMETIFVQKEIQYRLSILNDVYFNIEYFLSVLIKTFKITDESLGKTKIKNKQDYLSRVLNELNIIHTVDFQEISKEIFKRCNRKVCDEYKNLLKQDKKQTINLVECFLKIIDMRNSFHANGHANKDIKAFKIAQIEYPEVKKDEQFKSMGIEHIVPLLIIAIFTVEKIVLKLHEIKEQNASINGIQVPDIIVDNYVKDIRKLKECIQ